MKKLHLIFIFSFLFIGTHEKDDLYGKWKLSEDETFLSIMTSKAYEMGTDEQKTEMAKVFQFVLDSTFYEFKNDSVYFTDAGPGGIVKHKNGKWLLKQDTLVIIESGKVNSHKFIIDKLTQDELHLKVVLSDEIVSRNLAKFNKVK